jgi:ribosomal protein L32
MLLTNCQVCGEQVSRSAAICPHCGHPPSRSISEKFRVLHKVLFWGAGLAVVSTILLRSPLPLFAALWIGWILAVIMVRCIKCPSCGKSVFNHERRRTLGFSIGYWSILQPERVCSRCGFRLRND